MTVSSSLVSNLKRYNLLHSKFKKKDFLRKKFPRLGRTVNLAALKNLPLVVQEYDPQSHLHKERVIGYVYKGTVLRNCLLCKLYDQPVSRVLFEVYFSEGEEYNNPTHKQTQRVSLKFRDYGKTWGVLNE